MQLLARPDADDLDRQLRRERLGKIGDAHAWDLGNEDPAAIHQAERGDDEVHALLQR